MREALLQFIWKFRYFNHRELTTDSGERLYIHHPGESNSHQGPDFLGARIRFGDTLREGAVEVHILSSDWRRHRHNNDPHYSSVILHVVWENDCPDPPAGIPILTLCTRTPKILLYRYQEKMAHQHFVPCESLLSSALASTAASGNSHPPPTAAMSTSLPPQSPFPPSWSHQLLLQRLAQRTAFIRNCFDANHNDWELTTWWLMARSLGQPVNAGAFLAIARSLPLTLLLRHRADPTTLEALLLGQAGLLDRAAPHLLSTYHFYRTKYRLRPPGNPISFLRMRPAHFPTVRLSQLAALLTHHTGWFTLLRETTDPRALLDELDFAAPQKNLGIVIRKSMLLNAFIPVLYAYGILRQEPAFSAKTFKWLYETPPEHNAILTRWRRLGMAATNAAESQALLELKKSYCTPKKCLECAIGRRLLTAPAPSSNGTPPSPPYPDECCT